jgi:hypothetical protein
MSRGSKNCISVSGNTYTSLFCGLNYQVLASIQGLVPEFQLKLIDCNYLTFGLQSANN